MSGVRGEPASRPLGVTVDIDAIVHPVHQAEPPSRLLWLALALTMGVMVSITLTLANPWPWTCLTTALLGCASWLAWNQDRLAFPMVTAAVVTLGVTFGVSPPVVDAPHIGRTLTRVSGVVTTPPRAGRSSTGSMARFDHRTAGVWFEMRADALDAAVRVHVTANAMADLLVGSRITVTGVFSEPRPPMNPGEFDAATDARRRGRCGTLRVPTPELIVRHDEPTVSGLVRWQRMRVVIRRRLLDALTGADATRSAVLKALLLGIRSDGLEEVTASFRRVGVAHLLAISGLHLSILAGLAIGLVRWMTGWRRWQGVALVVIVALYLALIDVRLPVARAGLMTIAAGIAMAVARQPRASGLLALAALILIVARPTQVVDPGFQLSFVVVLALIHIAPMVRRRWFGRHDPEAPTVGHMLLHWLKTSMAAAITAWLVSTPLIVHHFGMLAPLTVPLSVLTIPILGIVLFLGVVTAVCGAILPIAGQILHWPLSMATDGLLLVVRLADIVPGSAIRTPFPTTPLWTIVSLGTVLVALGASRHRTRRLGWGGVLICSVWLYASTLVTPHCRIHMLAVGDGTCIVIRSGRGVLVFDAGSTWLDAGDRRIVPALHRLGVGRVGTLIVSHANIDHYSAVLEIADTLGIDEVRMTPQMLAAASGPVDVLLDGLTARAIPVTTISAGQSGQLGDVRWTCLQPDESTTIAEENDASAVVRLDTPTRTILLCGDIERGGISTLLRRGGDLRADIMELPHHGSMNDAAQRLLDAIAPRVVLQSTGLARWERDRWAVPERTNRLVTARDGAITVDIASDGAITAWTVREPARRPIVPSPITGESR